MQMFYCWITALTAGYQDSIITGLVQKGYMVGPLDKNGTVIAPGKKPSALIALSVYHSNKMLDVKKVYEDIGNICTNINALFYSIIVSKSIDCTWYGANFNIIDEKVLVPNSKKTMN